MLRFENAGQISPSANANNHHVAINIEVVGRVRQDDSWFLSAAKMLDRAWFLNLLQVDDPDSIFEEGHLFFLRLHSVLTRFGRRNLENAALRSIR